MTKLTSDSHMSIRQGRRLKDCSLLVSGQVLHNRLVGKSQDRRSEPQGPWGNETGTHPLRFLVRRTVRHDFFFFKVPSLDRPNPDCRPITFPPLRSIREDPAPPRERMLWTNPTPPWFSLPTTPESTSPKSSAFTLNLPVSVPVSSKNTNKQKSTFYVPFFGGLYIQSLFNRSTPTRRGYVISFTFS